MKVEMGESLFYPWLRHVKQCQIVQTNWKPSAHWTLHNEEALTLMMRKSVDCFQQEYGCDVFKKTSSFKQFLKQAEIDAVGIALKEGRMEVHAVDVAFHEGGLMYGTTRQEASMIDYRKEVFAHCHVPARLSECSRWPYNFRVTKDRLVTP